MKISNSARSTYLVLLFCTLPSPGCSELAQEKTIKRGGQQTKDKCNSTELAEKAKSGNGGVSGSDEFTVSNGQTNGEVTTCVRQVRTTKIKMAFLQCDIERYYAILGVYPKTLEGLAKPPSDAPLRDKWEAAGGLGIAEIVPDPWEQKFQYAQATKDSYRIWSMGPDGRNRTDDDIIGGADNSNVPSAGRLDIATAKQHVQMLVYFVDSYAEDIGELPLNLVPLETPPDDRTLASKWKGPYMKGEIDTDPWGCRYNYCVGPDNTFVIYSNGPNRLCEKGGGDDISSEELIYPQTE